ncbi:CDKN2A-interacting protein isoform X2 [Rhineura floridana]|uniref:CDKN2A-interacting protein isoform X2 n=1 Tax=Rhineura floridana TaxID=261503 RepID=UPI002AC804BF|nr:CDKN2A-interacting protein isoform X2 [Rhineura floridana]
MASSDTIISGEGILSVRHSRRTAGSGGNWAPQGCLGRGRATVVDDGWLRNASLWPMADGEDTPAVGPGSVSNRGNEKVEEAAGAGTDWVEKLRGECEPEQHWQYRREFLIRNGEALPLSLGGKDGEESTELRRLVSFSMVWANHIFLGCRYPTQVMEKVMDMATGITVNNAPTHTLRDELVAKVKRGISSSNEPEGPCKKRAVGTDKASEVSGNDPRSMKSDVPMETNTEPVKNPGKEAAKNPEKSLSSTMAQKVAPMAAPAPVAQKVASAAPAPVAQKVALAPVAQKATSTAPSTTVRVEARVANYESTVTARHKSAVASSVPESKLNYSLNKASESKSENALPSEKKVSLEDTAVLASKSGSHTSVVPAKVPCKLLTSEDAKERQPFFNRLYKAVAWKLVAVGGFSPNVNHVELLNSSIQSVKATLDVEFVPLKELADLPQNKSSQESVVCELRCKSVYLGTGCGRSKENAKAVASREALKLFLKKKVIVKLCKRKYKGREIEDLVLLDEESKPLNLPPALRNPQEIL